MDETGQDTEGLVFIVSVVLVRSDLREALESRVLRAEKTTGKGFRKWQRARIDWRRAFAATIPPLADMARFAWAEWSEGMDYLPRTAEALVRAANACFPGAQLIVILDGLKEAERPIITTALRQSGVRFRKVSLDCRDGAFPLLRLADAVAGFLRDVREGAPYAVSLWPEVQGLFLKV